MASLTSVNETLTRAGLNLIGQALSIYDSDLRCVRVNRRFQDMFDLPKSLCTPGAYFGDTIRYLAERGEYGLIENISDFVKTRVDQARAFEPHYMERTRANGRTISVEGSPLPQGGWVTVYTDITAIKDHERLLRARSEELSDQLLSHAERLSQSNRKLAATNTALEETKHQLMEMEARTRMTTEMMPAHISHVDVDGYYTFSNRKLNTVIPSSPSEILGMHITKALSAAAFSRIKPHYDQAASGTASLIEFTDEDSSRRIRAAFTPDSRADEVRGVYILSMDVTEEYQARAALAHTHKRELAAQLTSGLAHDFANLLTIILGMQSRLARFDQQDEAQELIAATQAAARRGGTMLNRIADMSGPREMRPEPVNLSAFMRDLKTLATPTLPEGVRLESHCRGLDQPVLLDAGSLQDSLLNLILNAKDAIGAHCGCISINTKALRDTWLEINVTDTGRGFGNEALEHALDPFFSTKGGEGSGLGLSMVYDLTKLAGGHMRLGNTADGANVTLRLPLRFAGGETAPKLVLLVEDSDDIRANVREMLTEMGHRVIEAASAEEGRALASLEVVEFILSDISLLGGETGVAMLDALAQTGTSAKSGLMTSLPKSDAIRQDASTRYPLISKPFSAQSLATFMAAEVGL